MMSTQYSRMLKFDIFTESSKDFLDSTVIMIFLDSQNRNINSIDPRNGSYRGIMKRASFCT
jgi:hypothetical protein